MSKTYTQFLDLQKSHLDAANAAGLMAVAALEKWSELNVATAKAVLRDSAAAMQSLRQVRDPQHFTDAVAAAAKPAAERWTGYSQDAYAIANGTRTEMTKFFQTQRTEQQHQVGAWISDAAANAPAGAEPAVAALRFAVANANAALDTFLQAGHAAADWTESSLTAAMNATIDAVTAAHKTGTAASEPASAATGA